MTIFSDILFGDSKKIYRREFNQALIKIPEISKEERAYLNEAFKGDLKDGLTEHELKERIEKLIYIPDDPLEPEEVKQVKRKLLSKFKG